MNKKKWFKPILGLLFGGLAGFAYYYFVGCRSGACPITGNPLISTAYGSLLGGLMTIGR